jgi:hypothetical protein
MSEAGAPSSARRGRVVSAEERCPEYLAMSVTSAEPANTPAPREIATLWRAMR